MAHSLWTYIRLRWRKVGEGRKLETEEEGRASKSSERLILVALGMMSDMMKDKDCCRVLSESKESIVADIVSPLLATTEFEKKAMIDHPEAFFNLAQDTCRRHNTGIPKTEAAKLLEAFIDHIDGALGFAVNLACDLVHLGALQMEGSLNRALEATDKKNPPNCLDLPFWLLTLTILPLLFNVSGRRKS